MASISSNEHFSSISLPFVVVLYLHVAQGVCSNTRSAHFSFSMAPRPKKSSPTPSQLPSTAAAESSPTDKSSRSTGTHVRRSSRQAAPKRTPTITDASNSEESNNNNIPSPARDDAHPIPTSTLGPSDIHETILNKPLPPNEQDSVIPGTSAASRHTTKSKRSQKVVQTSTHVVTLVENQIKSAAGPGKDKGKKRGKGIKNGKADDNNYRPASSVAKVFPVVKSTSPRALSPVHEDIEDMELPSVRTHPRISAPLPYLENDGAHCIIDDSELENFDNEDQAGSDLGQDLDGFHGDNAGCT
jgi:hypothetical protein